MKLDKFQEEAIGHINKGDSVLVSAPTGSGKTLIAEKVIENSIRENRKVIYTSPIKALSNQKYRDFSHQYSNRVGIITGDVNINASADILIMTTEIFRNRILDKPEMMKDHDWIIFDEIHFLDDYERGTAWEESIMFLPSHMNILALSATVPNIKEMADWIKSIHKKEIHIVEEKNRPVPLRLSYQCNNRIVKNINGLKKYRPYFNAAHARHGRRGRQKRYNLLAPLKYNRMSALIDEIKLKEYLPAIYFCFSRARCETLAEEINTYNFFDSHDERVKAVETYDGLTKRFDITNERSAIDLKALVKRGIAYHHAGMLPRLKETVEELFTHRLVRIIFTTETFALGINMPARAVIFDELRKFYGTHFATLRVRDFFQMAGRAGRRGMDEAGFVVSKINPKFISFEEIHHIVFGKTESVRSQFNSTYATMLNLYAQLEEELISAYPLSFHYFQSNAKKRKGATDLILRKIDLLKDKGYISEGRLTEKGIFAASIYGYELPLAELNAQGYFETLNPQELGILICSFVYEPRKNQEMPAISTRAKKIRQAALQFADIILRWEKKYKTGTYSKWPFFHATDALEAFMRGTAFSELYKISDINEGELVRIFRMTIQVLREIRASRHASDKLKNLASKAIELINRDTIDAEAELKS